jgi:geranylgeranyl reductase family protein
MDRCDVLVVGGGPAGSSCAWKLRRAGLDVIVVDRAPFPRDKVCAGWITPQVVTALGLDLAAYGQGRTLQPINGFRAGVISRSGQVEVRYDRPVSFGIRRCEFDHYLLERSGARLQLGEPIATLHRRGGAWIANDRVAAPIVVGAGGHWCPVARMLNPRVERTPLVVAQEAEFPIETQDTRAFTTQPDTPELFFSPDLSGYGWCFRKRDYLNIGFGRLDADGSSGANRGCSSAVQAFIAFLKARRTIPEDASWRRNGHAYLVATPRRRRVSAHGVLLVGDAAGLAYPQSGEGIRPAVESGLIAASTIIGAQGSYTQDRLHGYEHQLWSRLGAPRAVRDISARAATTAMVERRSSTAKPSGVIGGRVAEQIAMGLLRLPWFVRHIVLDRWFLRAAEPALGG